MPTRWRNACARAKASCRLLCFPAVTDRDHGYGSQDDGGAKNHRAIDWLVRDQPAENDGDDRVYVSVRRCLRRRDRFEKKHIGRESDERAERHEVKPADPRRIAHVREGESGQLARRDAEEYENAATAK